MEFDTTVDIETDRYFNINETCAFLGLTRPTLARWRREGIGPPAHVVPHLTNKRGGPVYRYRKSELVRFMESDESQAPRGHGCGGCVCGTNTAKSTTENVV